MPSLSSLEGMEVKTTSRWLAAIMSLTSGQSPPRRGILAAGNQYLTRPESLKARVSPLGART
ncbi:unnamed protein product [Spirodela intermedia]|uniref:Uncharacterized protein n=1 Tax=Spirodela intermedia TaxID=51605 RepID=A0A7I8K6W2_SPIIN|nr:unnamed protein product [Spirodela intermedia]